MFFICHPFGILSYLVAVTIETGTRREHSAPTPPPKLTSYVKFINLVEKPMRLRFYVEQAGGTCNLLVVSCLGTIACDMTLLATVVTGLVSGGFGTVAGDMSDLATVETTAVLSTGLVDDLTCLTLQPCVLTVTCDVSRLATIVTSLLTGGATAPSTTTSGLVVATTATSFCWGWCCLLLFRRFCHPANSTLPAWGESQRRPATMMMIGREKIRTSVKVRIAKQTKTK
jgi:hypothetical protein